VDEREQADPGVVGRRIRELRMARGMRQADLAGGRISVAYVSRIESGQRVPGAGILAEIAQRLDTTVDHLTTGRDPVDQAQAQLALRHAELTVRSGNLDDGASMLRSLLETPERLTSDDVWRARLALAGALEARGQYDEAIDVLADAASPYAASRTQAVIALCRCHREIGDVARAIEIGERALAQLDELELRDDDDAIRLEVTVAGCYFVRGDLAHASRICREAAGRAERSGSPTARAAAYWNASVIASERGRTQEAVELASRSLALLGEGEDARSIARIRGELGLLMLVDEASSSGEAASLLRKAIADLRASGASMADEARCELGLAQCALMDADLDLADRIARAVRSKAEPVPITHAQADIMLGRVAAARGDIDGAVDRYRAAAITLSGIMADRSVAQTWYEVGSLLDAAGDAGAARDAYRSAAAATGLQRVNQPYPILSELASH
jgi:tetratricopeptide (TPR) repeat protein